MAHFPAPFRLRAVDGTQPAGAYALDQEEELVPDVARLAYRRVGMFMHLPSISTGRLTLQLVPVEPSEVEDALLEPQDE